MTPTLNEKFLAYLALFSGLFLSLVAEYYSILGLTAIFAAAVIPVVIMGVALGLGKVTATLWLKQNWSIAPWSMRIYLFTAIIVLMMVTSMGIFGFLSKAHSDQSLVSGDVQAKIAVYDEKIKTAKENIDANRKALKQMDEAVDQSMGRSTDEKGADKAVAIRRSQQKERSRLLAEIASEQKNISQLSEERAPIASEVRKVEAEVGPIKYIAQFVYGDTNDGILEKAVTWVIIILIVVFDPMAVILLLSSQISFQNFREREKKEDTLKSIDDVVPQPEEYIPDDGPLTNEQIEQIKTTVTNEFPNYKFVEEHYEPDYILEPEKEKSILEQHPYLNKGFDHFQNLTPMVYKEEGDSPLEPASVVDDQTLTVTDTPLFIQNEEQAESNLWSSSIPHEEYYQISQAKLEAHANEVADLVRKGQMKMSEVPEPLQPIVKAKV